MLSRATVNNIAKNMTDHRGPMGMRDKAAGYTTNTSPGPEKSSYSQDVWPPIMC